MIDTPTKVEKTTTPSVDGEPTTPVAETETISKAELTKFRNIAATTDRVIKERDEARSQLAAQAQKEQLEALVLQVAEAHNVDPNLLMKRAPKMTKEELEDLAKDLPKTGEKPGGQSMKLYSGKTNGGEAVGYEQKRAAWLADPQNHRLWQAYNEARREQGI